MDLFPPSCKIAMFNAFYRPFQHLALVSAQWNEFQGLGTHVHRNELSYSLLK